LFLACCGEKFDLTTSEEVLMTRILVAYASKHHSTAEIAKAIGAILCDTDGFQVDVRSVETVSDITPYHAVVLGSAVYAGKWQEEAAEFLKQHEQELAQRPTWLFSSGPTGPGDPKTLMHGWELPEALRPIAARIKPRGVTVFSGKLDSASLTFFQRILVRVINASAFRVGDFRDWSMIRVWASGVAQALRQTAHA
jgi:menaquinone-dependent protoporphyrinogen oxidase